MRGASERQLAAVVNAYIGGGTFNHAARLVVERKDSVCRFPFTLGGAAYSDIHAFADFLCASDCRHTHTPEQLDIYGLIDLVSVCAGSGGTDYCIIYRALRALSL